MEKRLPRSAMIFSLGFVFMLVCAVGAFFYGVKLGTSKTETKYEIKELQAAAVQKSSPYQQQDLVSFYHTVFLSYREFQSEWDDAMDDFAKGQGGSASSTLKNLAELARSKRTAASNFDMQKSPLLGDAQTNYIRSLEQFEQAAKAAAASSKSGDAAKLQNSIKQLGSYQSAVKQALAAQQAYYTAMMKWGATVEPNIPANYTMPKVIEINKWSSLPLIVKNKLMADQMASRQQFTAYYPQDLTSRIDDFIASGQPAKLNLKTVSAIADLLIDTEAVRSGDFTENRSKLYNKDLLPQLPFFS
ncbi:hypothetical protein PghCCS26_33850 [Paenibacillus glycanilyticus]|uniref:Uncharacterized protein n=1 Tax=Paenibacillus glycanilyticus TaxID=126569 RepID=A0ABQ6NMC7_9BACL|nr:hypothetical protein [Paenibacillus glycanilyticus]GMK46256.1 hypothetical protein PghCCS26_33850 [Paenibacillus glycanilyticus]